MNDIKQNLLPVVALLITGITAFFAESHMPYKLSVAVYRYPAAIALIYAFFRFVVFADRRRTAQLDEVGLFRPLRDGAFLVSIHAHLIELGDGLGWLPQRPHMAFGVLAWAILLIGIYAPRQPEGLPARFVGVFPFGQTDAGRAFFCRGLKLSGELGIIGTFVSPLPIIWTTAPLLITAFLTRRRFGKRA